MPMYLCAVCKKEFRSYNPAPKFCSLVCRGDAQAPPLNIQEVSRLYSEGRTQVEIGSLLNVSQKTIHKAMKRHGIKARVAAKRDQHGPNNDSWKGDKAGYTAFHRRLNVAKGKEKFCEVCKTRDESRHYDWANLTGHYEDMNDYKRMCRSCHWKYDKKIKNIHHMKERC